MMIVTMQKLPLTYLVIVKYYVFVPTLLFIS